MAANLPTLQQLLDAVPQDRRQALERKVEDRRIVARVSRSIPEWPVAANHFPGVDKPDVEAIRHDHQLSLDLQKVGLIDKWIERNGHTATYLALAKCLYNAGAVDSVDVLCREFGAPPAPSERAIPVPTMKDLINNVKTVKTYRLGIQLDLDPHTVDRAIADNKNDSENQLIRILALYLEQVVRPSWLHVATALYAIGENGCAADIEMKFGVSVPSAASSSTPPSTNPDFKKTIKQGDTVSIVSLVEFATPAGTINIMQRVGADYQPLLGNILLKSRDGQRVKTIEMSKNNDVDRVVYDIFQKWLTEDEECTWGALVAHLKQAKLATLARDIESTLIE